MKIALTLVIGFILFGFVLDALDGFHVLELAKSRGWGIAGLITLSVFCGIGEAINNRIGSRDDVPYSL